MRYLFSLLIITFSLPALAVDETFVGGWTSKLLLVNMYDTAGLAKTGLAYSSMTITYTRNNAAADTDITEATMTMGTWVSGGWIEVDSTNSPGLYQFGIPDAAIADGAESVMFSFKATSTFQRMVHVSLVDVDLRNGANVAANTVQIEGSDATNQINTEADTALADYDAPTNAEMVARTVTSATYATASALSTAQSDITSILADTSTLDTQAELQTLLFGSATPGATASALSTAQTSINGLVTGVTLATSQPNYAPATAAALSTAQSDITAILTDTNAADTDSELQTLVFGSATPGATASALSTAQSGITSILADTDELQTRFNLMIEADGGDWRFDANSLEQAPTGGGGGGGDATAANQAIIISHLTDIKGATWNSSTDSLEAIANAIAAMDAGAGSGDTVVNQDTGGADALQVTDANGNGIQDVAILAYVASEFAANPRTATVRATATTSADGRWQSPYMMLESGTTYTLYFFKAGVYGPATTNVTP